MNLPLNTIEVKPENTCDVCNERVAKYYNTTYYIHICSIECFEKFIVGYNKEIEEISRRLLEPDELDKIDTLSKNGKRDDL